MIPFGWELGYAGAILSERLKPDTGSLSSSLIRMFSRSTEPFLEGAA